MRRKYEREERHKIIVDMNDFLITYALQIKGHDTENIAGQVYDAGKDDIKNLDFFLGDHGVGRLNKYHDIAEGSARNLYDYDTEKAEKEADIFCQEAMHYLGQHINDFNHWVSE